MNKPELVGAAVVLELEAELLVVAALHVELAAFFGHGQALGTDVHNPEDGQVVKAHAQRGIVVACNIPRF